MKYLHYMRLIAILLVGFAMSIASFSFWFLYKGEEKANDIKNEFINFLREIDSEWELIHLINK